jgi:hypothetical protein
MLDTTFRKIEQGEIDAIEALDRLLVEELTIRENRRVKTALLVARLTTALAGLRLYLPAYARSSPHFGAGRAEVRRSRRGRAPARPAGAE